MKKRRTMRSGFTFVETLLSIVIIGIIATVAAKILISGLDVYSLIVNRHNASQTARLAMERMVDEIVMIDTLDITWMSNERFSFRDVTGSGTNFKTKTVSKDGNSVQCIYREDDYLAGSVTSLDFDYLQADGSSTIWFWQVRKFNIDFTVTAPGDAGTIRIRTEVYPRNFMYDDFE